MSLKTENPSILIIDDDAELCDLLTSYLQQEGFIVETANDGNMGLERVIAGNYSLVVLDVMLPGLNGFEVLRKIRLSSEVPVLMLTARGDDVDRIVGLEMGADDYMPKPFNPRELVARIRAIGRRDNRKFSPLTTSPKQNRLLVGDVSMDMGTRTVMQHGKQVAVTAVEFSLLKELLEQAGNVVQREELARSVLGRNLEIFDRSIDVHVSNLRKKLGHEINGIERIKTIRGVGYLYTLETSS